VNSLCFFAEAPEIEVIPVRSGANRDFFSRSIWRLLLVGVAANKGLSILKPLIVLEVDVVDLVRAGFRLTTGA
jgi:hypothetical protein